MANSKRRTPIFTICSGGHQHAWKRKASRRHRRIAKQTIATAADYDAMVIPAVREVSDVWSSPSDGKMYWGNRQPAEVLAIWMRK